MHPPTHPPKMLAKEQRPPGQIVLVLQGGGALGAYQVGVYQALHEAGIEPDWVIGTSIGAINAALIAGNPPEQRLTQLERFWNAVEWRFPWFGQTGFGPQNNAPTYLTPTLLNPVATTQMVTGGVPGFFQPRPVSWISPHLPLGVEHASYYDTTPLKETLNAHVDFDRIRAGQPRLTVGAVNVRSGTMRYFDSHSEPLSALHIMASGALPPAFGAVRIEGEPYWDGGLYSNTPIEAVLNDNPRRSSTIFSVQLWNPDGSEPDTLWQVMGRQKEIQYSSRADSQIAHQQQLHHMRHIIRALVDKLPERTRNQADVCDYASWGCQTLMHVALLRAPRLRNEDHTKDIDFTPAGIAQRCEAGFADARDLIMRAPWAQPVDAMQGIVLHTHESTFKAAW